MRNTVEDVTGNIFDAGIAAEHSALVPGEVTQSGDETADGLCLDPTQSVPKLACSQVRDLRDVSHLFESRPTAQDVAYEALKTQVAAGNERAALKLGKGLAEDLPQGRVLVSNMVLRGFPASRRARRLVKSFATTTTDPSQRGYLQELQRSYFP